MSFEHRQRRTIEVRELYSTFKAILDRTRTLNSALQDVIDTVEDYWEHHEIEIAAETLLDYVCEDDGLNEIYNLNVEGKLRLEMLVSDVVKTLQILEYTGSKRHSWNQMEVLFYD